MKHQQAGLILANRTIMIAAAAMLLEWGVPAQAQDASAGGTSQQTPVAMNAAELLRKLEQEIPRWLSEYAVPAAAVAYIVDGEIAWTAVCGEQSPGVAATPKTVFNIASLTKPITSETILRLAAAGEIELDESMALHWVDPDIADNPLHRQLTPRMALSHRTGFASNWRRETDRRLELKYRPGSRSQYSGEGYDYVARFAERKLGQSFEELTREHLFGPSGMDSTSFTPQPWFQDRVAMVRGPDGSRRLPDVSKTWSAADNVHTTIGDYARFVRSAMAGEGLTAELLAQRRSIAENQVGEACPRESNTSDECPERVGFGLGWHVFDNGKEVVMMHFGGGWGERTLAFFVPERRLGVVVFTSGANGLKVIRDSVALLYRNPELNALLAAQASD